MHGAGCLSKRSCSDASGVQQPTHQSLASKRLPRRLLAKCTFGSPATGTPIMATVPATRDVTDYSPSRHGLLGWRDMDHGKNLYAILKHRRRAAEPRDRTFVVAWFMVGQAFSKGPIGIQNRGPDGPAPNLQSAMHKRKRVMPEGTTSLGRKRPPGAVPKDCGCQQRPQQFYL